ncbi:hypothetical protein, partial [Acidiphilium sp.]|uniref:hypothetical protein n=1 Tax=Acidiphilium sp. TaxID=527 RepID=UPI003D078616
EHRLHTAGVTGSIPVAPTRFSRLLQRVIRKSGPASFAFLNFRPNSVHDAIALSLAWWSARLVYRIDLATSGAGGWVAGRSDLDGLYLE